MAQQIKKVGVLGAGLMGHGIAQVAAQSGYEVVLREVDEATLDKGIAKIEKQLARAVEKGKSTQEDADAVRARIEGTTHYRELADCDLVLEAITENLALKLEMWKEVDGIVKPEAFFATNTSSLRGDRPGRRDQPPRPLRRPALLQPRAGDEAGRGRALRDDRSTSPSRPRSSSRARRGSSRSRRRTRRLHRQPPAGPVHAGRDPRDTRRASARSARSTRR